MIQKICSDFTMTRFMTKNAINMTNIVLHKLIIFII